MAGVKIGFCIIGCDRRETARGFCRQCYQRIRRSEDHFGPEFKIFANPNKSTASWAGVDCSEADCDRPAHARGLCTLHYQRAHPSSTPRERASDEDLARWAAEKRERDAERKAADPEGFRVASANALLWTNYRLRPGDYDRLLEAQGGTCAICRKPCVSGRRLAVDHDHQCCSGKKSCGECIRGLLCGKCNQGLGHFDDSPELMTEAISYLKAGGVT